MIFITVGSRSFQFDRLLKAVDLAIEKGEILDEVFAQVGSSTYQVKNYKTVDFLNHEEFNKKLNECDIVLTHGGTGVIVNAIKLGKRVVAVPRLVQYHEVVDDHQIQLVEAFEKLGMATGCYECDKISEAIKVSKEKEVMPYVSNTKNIIDSIDAMITSCINENVRHDKSKLRILMCSSDRKEKGGMNTVIDQLMNHDWGTNFELSYLATHVTGNAIKKILFFGKAYIKLKKLLKEDEFDIIHIHMSYNGSFYRKYYVTKSCKKYGKKVIVHLHGSEFKDFYNNGGQKRKSMIVELFTIADCTIVLGEQWKQFINKIAPKSNVAVINNAVHIPEIGEKEESQERVLLFLGALIKRKGIQDLLKALNKIQQNGINGWHLLIAGSGEEEVVLKEYVKKNSLEEQVEFLGWINKDKKNDLLMKSDVLILPSYNEGLPMAILEAMSYGLAIVSTDIGSINEAVNNGLNGYLYNPGDIEELERIITKLVADDALWKKQSRESRRICIEKFSEDTMFTRIDKIWTSLYGE